MQEAVHESEYGTLFPNDHHQLRIVSQRYRVTRPRSKDQHKSAGMSKYWLPLPLRMVSSIMTVVISLAVLTVLEVLLHLSNQDRGLGQVDGKSGNYMYAWHIVSAAVMTMIAVMFESLDFAVTNLETFRHLSKHATTAKDSILRNFNGRSSAYSLYQAFRYRRITIAATSLLSLLSPFLTIFASGLYSAVYPESTHLVSATRLSWFNTSDAYTRGFYTGLFETSSNSIDATLIQYDNLTYPQWTFNELALAELAMPNHIDHGTNLQAHIPAVRASVQCAFYPASAIFNASGPESYFIYPALDCGSSATCFNRTAPQQRTPVTTYFNESGFFGGSYSPDFYSDDEECGDATCGTFIFGRMQDANSTSSLSFHALHCLFGVDQLLTSTQLSLPNYNIISTTPLESTVSPHSNLTLNPDKVLSPVNASLLYGGSASYDQYNGFLTALTHGRDAIPATELFSNTTVFIDALTHFYRVSMAQVLSEYFRSVHPDNTLPFALQPGSSPESTMTILHTRALQNETSTRLLQGLLAVLVVLALIAQLSFRPRKILYENPNTIAAMGRLLLGSELLDDDELVRELREAERLEWKRKEINERGLLSRWRFSLKEETAEAVEDGGEVEEGSGNGGETVKRKIDAIVKVKEKVKGVSKRKDEDESPGRRRIRLVAMRIDPDAK